MALLKFTLVPFFFIFLSQIIGHDSVGSILIKPTWSGQEITMDQSYSVNGASVRISKLQFYISNLKCYSEDHAIPSLNTAPILIDFSDSQTLSIPFINEEMITKITFDLGIDSLTNISGAYGGDLDPTKGMYWTWQSGYINFKLEGKCPLCNTRNNKFQLHLGGYEKPYSATQSINLEVLDDSSITLVLPLDHLLENLGSDLDCNIMSPGHEALSLSQHIARILYLE